MLFFFWQIAALRFPRALDRSPSTKVGQPGGSQHNSRAANSVPASSAVCRPPSKLCFTHERVAGSATTHPALKQPPPMAAAGGGGGNSGKGVNAPIFVPNLPGTVAPGPPGLASSAAAVAAKPFVPSGGSGGGPGAVNAKPFIPGGGGAGGSLGVAGGLPRSNSSTSITSGAVHAPIFVPGALLPCPHAVGCPHGRCHS